jgi:hypothetical protein
VSVEEDLDALEAAGWTLVTQRAGQLLPVPSTDEVREVNGLYMLERRFRGCMLHESGETLAEAVERATREQTRLATLSDYNPPVRDGLMST